MIHFSRLQQLRLSLSICVWISELVFDADFALILGLKFWTEIQDCPMAMWGRICGLSMTCLWPGSGLDLDSPGVVVCVDCFVGISYATIGLENQVVFACF